MQCLKFKTAASHMMLPAALFYPKNIPFQRAVFCIPSPITFLARHSYGKPGAQHRQFHGSRCKRTHRHRQALRSHDHRLGTRVRSRHLYGACGQLWCTQREGMSAHITCCFADAKCPGLNSANEELLKPRYIFADHFSFFRVVPPSPLKVPMTGPFYSDHSYSLCMSALLVPC